MKTRQKPMRCAIWTAATLLAAATAAASNVWWVDDANYGAPGRDGSEANPFGTIHEAIANAACVADDTIKVKPGIYDKDGDQRMVTIGSTQYQMCTRVFINKKVHIVATGTKEETHIVGRFCPVEEGGHATWHSGPTAVRCVYVTADGLGSTLTGFTLRESATVDYAAADYSYNCGGAISVANFKKGFYVTDCVISNCVARHFGGASYGGTLNRCLVRDCRIASARGLAVYKSHAINSVFAGCQQGGSSSPTLAYSTAEDRFVNCTFYGNKAGVVMTPRCYNCLFVGNNTVETNGTDVIDSNVYASSVAGYKTASPFQLLAPALGDYHPLPDSAALGAGDPSYLTSTISLPAGTEIRDMDGVLIDLAAEHVTAGAYQTPKAPAHGGVLLTAGMASVNGLPTYGSNLFYATSWPMSVKVEPGSGTYRLAVTGEKTADLVSRYAGVDGYLCITPPYAAGAIQTNRAINVNTSVTRYVDAANGSDDNDGKTASRAYQTIQKAIDASTGTAEARIVYVAEGDYRTGGGVARGVTNRVNCTGARYFKFIATGDRDKTIIRGAAAKDERDPVNHPGCGPDAVRCVSYSYNSATYDNTLVFVGFTFADGHTDVGQDAANDMCGAAYGRSGKSDALQFIDCVFTNCYAPAGGVSTRAHFTRCRFIDCGSGAEGFRYSILNACAVESGNYGTGVFGIQVRAVNCSVADSNALADDTTGQIALNCALGDGGTLPAAAVTWGSTARPCFADAANGDLRVVSGSPALDAARRDFPAPGDAGWSDFTAYFSDFASDNIDGTPWVCAGGFPVAGVYLGQVAGLALPLDPAHYSITGATAGGNALAPGDVVTIARAPSAVRHYGLVVNGVTNLLDAGAYTYTVPASADGEAPAIEEIVDPNWYVNPNPASGANDAQNGFTPATPKLTLAGVLSVATNAGDVVNAAPGTYERGEMRVNPADTVAARGVVASNVTLKATGRADETVIRGADSPSPANNYGQGPGAVRCLALHAKAVVDGFTLTGGRTLAENVSYDGYGGGVLGVGANKSSLVRNCILSNNVAGLGGGGAYSRHLKCRIFGNRATQNGDGGALYRSGLVQNCLIDGNYGLYTVMYADSIYNCTIGRNNGNRSIHYFQPSAEEYKVFNSILYYPNNDQSIYWNCALANDKLTVSEANLRHGSFTTTFAALKLDEDLRPAIDSPVVGAGDDEKRGSLFPETDIDGVPRVLNDGRFDIGACEFDWRGTYAETLGPRIVVTDVTSNVVAAADAVRVPDGSLSLDWQSRARSAEKFVAGVTGEGTLTIRIDGADYATLTAADGRRTFTAHGTGSAQRFDFLYSGDGYAELAEFVQHYGFKVILR